MALAAAGRSGPRSQPRAAFVFLQLEPEREFYWSSHIKEVRKGELGSVICINTVVCIMIRFEMSWLAVTHTTFIFRQEIVLK